MAENLLKLFLTISNTAILNTMDTQDKVLLGYHTQKLLAEVNHDKYHLNQLLQQMNTPPENIRGRLLQERIDRRLNIIPDENFQKVIENLPQHQAQTLIEQRKHAQEKELKELEKLREQTKSHDLTRSR